MTQTSLLDVDARPVALRRPHDAGRGAETHVSLLGRPNEGDGTGTYAPLATWAIVSAIALAAGALLGGHAAPAIAAALGALVAIFVVPFERYGRLLTLAALVPAALALSFAPAWLLAGALVAYAVGRSRAPVVVAMNELERHLSWCRRRDEQADVLAMRIDGSLREPERVVRAFRITDSVELRRRAGGYDLTAVLDHQDLDRAGIERRMAGLGIAPIAWGWALFPRDGFTLDVLVERARRSVPGAEAAERDGRQSPAASPTRSVA